MLDGLSLEPPFAVAGGLLWLVAGVALAVSESTATRAVREDVRRVLGADEGSMPLFAAPVDRPNLMLGAAEVYVYAMGQEPWLGAVKVP